MASGPDIDIQQYKKTETYNSKPYYLLGVRSFWLWLVQNNQPDINAINTPNQKQDNFNLETTLSINFPHSKLKIVMRELINFCLKVGKKLFIAVKKSWCNMN